jgi:type II secretory pathway component PulF
VPDETRNRVVNFTYEAMTNDGRVVSDRVEGASSADAAETLRAKGLTLLRLEAARSGSAESDGPSFNLGSGGAKPGDLVLFTRQLKMLLEAGSALVPALEAIEQQTTKPAFSTLVHKIREHVEEGGTLSEAFHQRPRVFKPVFCSMVSAGEATASLPDTFARLNDLAVRQQQTRRTVIGALLYPAFLSLLCVAVAGVVLGFVVPRFTTLFNSLNAPLPRVTQFLFGTSEYVLAYWPMGVGVLTALVTALVIVVRVKSLRQHLDSLVLGVPVIGRVASRLIFARVLRIWAAMLRSHVPLLDTIQHSKSALTNRVFVRLLNKVEDAVAGGGSIGHTLANSGLVEPVVASAIRTGEDNGRLTEAVEFVSKWMDDDNNQLVAGLTRIAEPALLTIMGIFVGLVAMSLFVPLFDLATAGV